MKLSFVLAAVLALTACNVEPAAQSSSLKSITQEVYNPVNDGEVWLVEQGELAWPAIAGAIGHRIEASPDQIKYAKGYEVVYRMGFNTRAVFISYHLWNRDGKTLQQIIQAIRNNFENPDIKVYVYAHDPTVEAEVLGYGAHAFIHIPNAPDLDAYTNMRDFGVYAYQALYGVNPPPID